MLSLLAALLLAQAPTPSAQSGWHWTRVYGQPVQVWSIERRGELIWGRDWSDPLKVAPVELARRNASHPIDQPPLLPVAPSAQTPGRGVPNYGVMAQELAHDGRTIRASDPDTLKLVTQDAARRRPKCPDDRPDPEPEPERKPGPIQRAEWEVERLLVYAVAACLILAAFVLLVRFNPPPEPRP